MPIIPQHDARSDGFKSVRLDGQWFNLHNAGYYLRNVIGFTNDEACAYLGLLPNDITHIDAGPQTIQQTRRFIRA